VKSHIDEELHAHMGLDSYAHHLGRPTDDRKFPAARPRQFCGGVTSSRKTIARTDGKVVTRTHTAIAPVGPCLPERTELAVKQSTAPREQSIAWAARIGMCPRCPLSS
jgi:hypothetical protein